MLGKSDDSYRRVGYRINKFYTVEAASKGRSWCFLIKRLDEASEGLVPHQFREDRSVMEVWMERTMLYKSSTRDGNNRFAAVVNGVVKYGTATATKEIIASSIVTARPLYADVSTSEATFKNINQGIPRHQSNKHGRSQVLKKIAGSVKKDLVEVINGVSFSV